LVKKYAVKVNIDDTTSAIFEFKKNCTGSLTTIFACPYTTTFNIFATNMNIFSDVDKNKIKIIHKDGIIQKINLSKKNTLFLELQEFADNCKNKKKYRIKNSEAAHNVKVMEAIVKSSKNNKKIYL
jgi:predicted dehydrogenase